MKINRTIATVGFFDGVHRGHRYLVEQMQAYARSAGLKTAVITFPQHPRKVLQQDFQPKLLNTFDERMEQLASTGVDYCFLLDFTQAFAQTSAQDFIQKIIREQLQVEVLLIGYDHRFGKNREESVEQYIAYGAACGLKVLQADPLPASGRQTSSTLIRRLLEDGRIREANDCLSYAYTLSGTVIHGNHLGRTSGFPTANSALDDPAKLIPKEGVYAARVEVEGREYGGMAYIGKRPTVASDGEQRLEVNIFDFDCDIYGETLRMELTDYIRPDQRFDGLEALTRQLTADREAVLKISSQK
jgi:riboflavin kinase/FMN adenylyltransferase